MPKRKPAKVPEVKKTIRTGKEVCKLLKKDVRELRLMAKHSRRKPFVGQTDKRKWLKEMGPGWASIVGNRTAVSVCSCEFGFAEECVSLLAFDDGTFEVGVGECLRPYLEEYQGADLTEAWYRFYRAAVQRM